MKKSPSLALAGAVLIAVVLSGCVGSSDESLDASPGEPDSSTSAAPADLPEGFGSQAADGEFPRTVTHFGGDTEITEEPTRIAILATGQLDASLSLGIVPVAAARADDAGLVPEYLSQAFTGDAAAIAEMVDLGTRKEPDFEKLAEAKPDLILANEQGFEEDFELLNSIAPTVLTEGEGVNWAQDFLIIASALGKLGDAQQIIADIDEQAQALGESVAGQTFSFIRIQTDRTRIFGVGSFLGSLAERAGMERPQSQQFAETSEEISLEQTNLAAADWVFFAVPDGEPGDAPPESLIQGIGDATTPDQIVSVNEDTWFLNAGPRAATIVLEEIAAVTAG